MNHVFLHTPSVGGVLKKIMEINPALTAPEMIDIIKQSVHSRGGEPNDGFSKTQIVDEGQAIALARASLEYL